MILLEYLKQMPLLKDLICTLLPLKASNSTVNLLITNLSHKRNKQNISFSINASIN